MSFDPHGKHLIAGQWVAGSDHFPSSPASGESYDFSVGRVADVNAAVEAAEAAFAAYSSTSRAERAAFLHAIADEIEARADDITAIGSQETGLPEARLQGERGRTTGQLRLFAEHILQGDYLDRRHDKALPDRAPLPRPDLRMVQRPIGPIAVFGASNFPLAFSTAGGDTASALAAGCPVVFKAHNAHPGTGELVGQAIAKAVRDFGLHPGVFSLVYGPGASIGQALVADPTIKAVGFTGSQSAGIALMRTAAARPEPIPVYAEMSSLNPVFVFHGALTGSAEQIDSLAQQYVAAVTGSSGQLCTSPGLLFAPAGEAGDKLAAAVGRAVSACAGQTMLTAGIAGSWNDGAEALGSAENVTVVGRGSAGATENAPAPTIFGTGIADFISNHLLHAEIFGAASLVIRYSTTEELIEAARCMEGQLTSSLQLTEEDYPTAARLLPALEQKVGRIIVNGWPTGVEVGHAMVHGGPFPATSDTRTTSVGTLAINRFLRPVAYQNLPQELLPVALQDDNPWRLNRRMDGIVEDAAAQQKAEANA